MGASAWYLMANTPSLRRLCLAVLLGSAPCWSIEALPCVGRVSSATRTLSVIGTVHTPSRQQLREVAQLIRSTRPDVVLVELDQPRLEQLLKQQRRAGPLGGPPSFSPAHNVHPLVVSRTKANVLGPWWLSASSN